MASSSRQTRTDLLNNADRVLKHGHSRLTLFNVRLRKIVTNK